MKKVLVIAPHGDDEVLGCGGTILKHIDNGDKVYIVFVGNVRPIDNFQEKIENSCRILNVTSFFKLGYKAAHLDEVTTFELVGKLSEIISKLEPNIIYLNNPYDVHSDHEAVFKAGYSCTKNFRYPFIEKVLIYEVQSETEFGFHSFIPNYFVDITDYMETKILAMNAYDTELLSPALPRSINSIKAQCRLRGSRIGVEYAEAFILYFEKS